jgi:hypothetical protein
VECSTRSVCRASGFVQTVLPACGLPESAARAVSSRTDRDLSTSGGFRGCPCLCLRCRADRLGRNFESILVHIESLFPVQAFDKLTCRPSNGSRKTRRIHFDRRFHCSFISISAPQTFSSSKPPFSDDEDRNRFAHSKPRQGLKTAETFNSNDAFDLKLSFRSASFSGP